MFDLYPHEQEVNLANDNILEMISMTAYKGDDGVKGEWS